LAEKSTGEQAWEGLWIIDRASSKAEFSVRFLTVARTTGAFGEVGGTIVFDEETPERSSVEATIDVTSIDTGNEKRDEDLLEERFLDADSFPHMRVTGDLTIRDVKKEIELDVRYKGLSTDGSGSQRAAFDAETTLSREDFAVNWGGTAGRALVGDTVDVKLYLEAIKRGFAGR
jgi:polyisoprenoid-binding protein YceI